MLKGRRSAITQLQGFSKIETQPTYQPSDYTRIYCAEPAPDYYHSANSDIYVPLFTHDPPLAHPLTTIDVVSLG
jgi:hypothetical protein